METSKEDDYVHVLNTIMGCSEDTINDTPYKTHVNYYGVNNALIESYVSTIPIIIAASKECDEM